MHVIFAIATITFPWQMCQGHPPVEDMPIQVQPDCSFSHAGKEHPISGGPVYRMKNGMMGQTITHRDDGYCRYRTTLVVDCERRESILIPNSGAIWGFEVGELEGDGPPLPGFLTEDQQSSVPALASVYGDVRMSFMVRLRADEGGAGPDAFCGCNLPNVEVGQD